MDAQQEQTLRQVVKYSFFKLDEAFLRLPETKQRDAKLDFIHTLRNFRRKMLLRTYSLVGLRGDVDFLLWQVAEDVDAFQQLHTAVRNTALGAYLTMPRSFLSGTKRSVYDIVLPEDVDGEHEEERIIIEPSEAKYLFVYPFIKTRAWYDLPPERRQEMITEHIRVGRKYPDIKLNTTYSFGVDDQEFVVAFEGDDPHDFVDLVQELRHTEASMYTLADTPMHTAINMTLAEMVDSLGGASVADLVEEDASEVGGWLDVASIRDFDDQPTKLVYYGSQQVALFMVDGEVLAINNRCPHARGPLCEGEVKGRTVSCPWHEATFDLETGKSIAGISPRDVESFQVNVQDGRVFISRIENQPELEPV
jgi:chlorite dismutase/nitrite reductase/ring-hydroxylating ferredoxin subunit